jgi:hypothetical protein
MRALARPAVVAHHIRVDWQENGWVPLNSISAEQ